MYHRVTELDADLWSMAVTPKHFAEHLEVLREYGYPLHLQELINKLVNYQPLQRQIVITFDDGYADNLYNAKPLLEKFDIPATVFVTSSIMERETEFWWDDLETILLRPATLPNFLQFEVQGINYQWELGEAANYSVNNQLQYSDWRFLKEPEENPTRRHTLYRAIYKLLRILPADERQQIINELYIWAGSAPKQRKTHHTLTKEELIMLEKGSLIEIGAHTVTHPYLSEYPVGFQRDEIIHSKAHLEDILNRDINSFAYPYGDYTTETVSLVKDLGFNCACSCEFARVKTNTDLFLLPRIAVEDCDGDFFAKWLLKSAF